VNGQRYTDIGDVLKEQHRRIVT